MVQSLGPLPIPFLYNRKKRRWCKIIVTRQTAGHHQAFCFSDERILTELFILFDYIFTSLLHYLFNLLSLYFINSFTFD